MTFTLIFKKVALFVAAASLSLGGTPSPLSLLHDVAMDQDPPSDQILFSAMDEEVMRQLSIAETAEMLGYAAKLLVDPRSQAEKLGIVAFLSGTLLRTDYERRSLLEPHFTALEHFAEAGEPSLRIMALQVMSKAGRELVPRTIAYFLTRLKDPRNTSDEIRLIAASLVEQPSNQSTRMMVELIGKWNNLDAIDATLHQLCLMHTQDSYALAFIDKSLENPEPNVRASAVSAIALLTPQERGGFVSKLQRIANNPNEAPSLKTGAERLLR